MGDAVVDEPSRRRPPSCPDCGGPVRIGEDRLCPRCGYPLMYLRLPEEERTSVTPPARLPGEQDSGPAPPAPALALAEEPPSTPDTISCPNCRYVNHADRTWCERCGYRLKALPPPPVVLPPPAPSNRWRIWVFAAVVVLAIASVATAFVLLRDDDPASPPPVAKSSAPTAIVRVPPNTIKVTATTAIPGDRYRPENTLDGANDTAWHSNGPALPNNNGQTLTFTFDKPVRLVRVTINNGFNRSPTDYTNNERIASAEIVTDAGTKQWQPKDTGDPQTLELDGAPTTKVQIVVRGVYPGTKYRDVTVSEAAFDELR
ncbi:NADase-type glycan-binding domain-containing protein [Virgisporangium aliadipatigenens]|uniref:NADase-type glycan-binding domain-containing protein n=1 Tax=Virgisporangium aliadipatigenens TaxID=741659 RepID=UPI001941C110|nr:hypothetical protein [Virgisporangium aliadipatigenens]